MTVMSQRRTRAFARVLGPFLTIAAITVVVRANDMPALLSEFTGSAVWPWITGAFGLLGGLTILAFHQFWREPAAIIVSVLGWLLTAEAILLMAFPGVFADLGDQMIGAVGVWRFVYAVLGLIGLYLAYAGWRPTSAGQTDTAVESGGEMPRAA
ncbi:hypothetical protein [Mycolicibacterium elephantis]|nr:hypothetical protein [Mycolicibacterium elephantis]MCV7219831.1 hypothetical protein [Mycolicibacterium elephantis]